MTPNAIDELASEVARLNNLPIEEAERFVAEAGDTPELNDKGAVIIRDEEGAIAAVLNWPIES
ncbi:hypothetical protein BH09VER1_BH09VER1_24660 [soil metagenome]